MDSPGFLQECMQLSWEEHKQLDAMLARLDFQSTKSIRTIGIFSESIRMGGLGRVIVLLSNLFKSIGYSVVILTDDHISAFADSLAADTALVILPRNMPAKLMAIKAAIDKHNIDFCIFNDHHLQQTFFLFKFARLLGLKTCVISHGVFFYPLYEGWFGRFRERIEAFRHCDAIVCLTPSDKKWWTAFGVPHTACIPNPSPYLPESTIKTQGMGKKVYFIGRFGHEKGIVELPRITRESIKSDPEARFVLLGDFERKRDKKRFWREAKRYGIEKYFELKGFVDNVSEHLSKASVVIIPSMYESYSLVRVEAAAHGVPVVMFSMPYLLSEQEESGIVMVGKKDVLGMSGAIVKLLNDREFWQELSAHQQSMQPVEPKVLWEQLIISVQNNSVAEAFPPPDGLDYDFVKSTFEECTAVAEANVERWSCYKYLRPLDLICSWFFPEGSKRRELTIDSWNKRRR